MRINKIYYNKIKNKKLSRKTLCLFILFIFICLSSIYQYYKYNKFIDAFKANFNEYKFSEANNLILTNQNFNLFKLFRMNNDIFQYFNTKVTALSEDIQNKNISSEDALIQLKEIQRYDLIPSTQLHNISDSIDLIKGLS